VAGDVGFAESNATALGSLGTAGAPGPILHDYGGGVQIVLGAAGRSAHDTSAAENLGSNVPGEERAPDTEALGLRALALRESQEYVSAKAARPYAGSDWGSVGEAGPQVLHMEAGQHAALLSEASDVEAGAPTPGTSDRLTGRVAVGLFIVDGPQSQLKFSGQERIKVVAEVQNGLSWLAGQAPARDVTWVHDIKTITSNAAETQSGTTYEDFEAPWRDAALASLGYGPGLAAVGQYTRDLRTRLGTDWAYLIFFVKYRLHHFAYASLGGPRLVMHYENDGWGPDNIDSVVAHETGHIFGAPDEYRSSGCDCGGSYGFFGKPNGNCEACAQALEPCIMRANTWAMCRFTPFHLGFDMSGQAPIS